MDCSVAVVTEQSVRIIKRSPDNHSTSVAFHIAANGINTTFVLYFLAPVGGQSNIRQLVRQFVDAALVVLRQIVECLLRDAYISMYVPRIGYGSQFLFHRGIDQLSDTVFYHTEYTI